MPKRACDGCSIRKIRCEGIQPCRACVKAGLSCTFLKALRKGGPRKPHQKTIQQIHKTQIEFSQLAGGLSQAPTSNPLGGAGEESGDSVGEGPSSLPSTPEGHENHRYNARRNVIDEEYDTDEFELGMSSTTTSSVGVSRFRPQFPVSVLAIYLEIFHHRLYSTWPIIHHRELLEQLRSNPRDVELYCLAITMACATMEQLQLPPWTHHPTPEDADGLSKIANDPSGGILVSSDRFAAEALRLRRQFGLSERPSIMSVLMGLFLHVYFENKKKPVTATLYLREAVSFVQILRLDRESTYTGGDEKEEDMKKRVFWLMFITERGHTMVHDMPFVLRNTISLPNFDPVQEPLLVGFMNLVQLFASFDQSVIDAWISGDQYSCSRDLLADMQRKLRAVSPDESAINETQKTDILITKHWMRTLVWQVAMSHGFLSSSGDSEESMNMTFPTEVAGDLLDVLGTVRRENVECHGPGMELKLFEVTNSLADVILCVLNMKPAFPSTTVFPPTNNCYTGSMRFGPRDYLKGLFDLMVNFRGGNPTLINIIKQKASQLLVNDPDCDVRLLELPDEQEGKRLPNINRGYSVAGKGGYTPSTTMSGSKTTYTTEGGNIVSPATAAVIADAARLVEDLEQPPDEEPREYTWGPEISTPSPKFSDKSNSDSSSPVPGFSGLEVAGDIRTMPVTAEDISAAAGGMYVTSNEGYDMHWNNVPDQIMEDVGGWESGVRRSNAVTTWMKDVE